MTKRTILFADDDKNVRDAGLFIFRLDFPNYRIESFSDGTSLDKALKNGSLTEVCAVITDNNMPGVSGLEIIKRYANDRRFGRIPFILYYAGSQEIGERAKQNGAFDYILKPHSISVFSKTIRDALNQR